MRISLAIGLTAVTAFPVCAYGQDSLVGKYLGNFVVTSAFPNRPNRTVRVELAIASVENGVVKGTGKSYSPSCGGSERSIEGKVEGNQLKVQATEQSGGCTMAYSLTVDGKKLMGTTTSG